MIFFRCICALPAGTVEKRLNELSIEMVRKGYVAAGPIATIADRQIAVGFTRYSWNDEMADEEIERWNAL